MTSSLIIRIHFGWMGALSISWSWCVDKTHNYLVFPGFQFHDRIRHNQITLTTCFLIKKSEAKSWFEAWSHLAQSLSHESSPRLSLRGGGRAPEEMKTQGCRALQTQAHRTDFNSGPFLQLLDTLPASRSCRCLLGPGQVGEKSSPHHPRIQALYIRNWPQVCAKI